MEVGASEYLSTYVFQNFSLSNLSRFCHSWINYIFVHALDNYIYGIYFVFLFVLQAMGRAAISLSKLADTAREELPSTMAAIRLSGMEISDLTLELSDLR